MLERDEAIEVLRVIDNAGFSCTLGVTTGHGDSREYEVSVNLKGLTGDRLRELQSAVTRSVPEAWVVVNDYGHLIVR
jgi:hypothetical protein